LVFSAALLAISSAEQGKEKPRRLRGAEGFLAGGCGGSRRCQKEGPPVLAFLQRAKLLEKPRLLPLPCRTSLPSLLFAGPQPGSLLL